MEYPKPIEDKIVDGTNYRDGVFYFSNTSKDEFKALWNNVEYIFAPESCSAIMIPDHTALQIQQIRKQWALNSDGSLKYRSKKFPDLSTRLYLTSLLDPFLKS